MGKGDDYYFVNMDETKNEGAIPTYNIDVESYHYQMRPHTFWPDAFSELVHRQRDTVMQQIKELSIEFFSKNFSLYPEYWLTKAKEFGNTCFVQQYNQYTDLYKKRVIDSQKALKEHEDRFGFIPTKPEESKMYVDSLWVFWLEWHNKTPEEVKEEVCKTIIEMSHQYGSFSIDFVEDFLYGNDCWSISRRRNKK